MSKAHDESSRGIQPPEVGVTPPPEPVLADDGSAAKRREATGPRRVVRAGIQRERSGPIGIASGDFATPSVRRRTITQPRGTPISGLPVDLNPPLPGNPLEARNPPRALDKPAALDPPSAFDPPLARDPPLVLDRPLPAPFVPVTTAEPPPIGATPVDLVDATGPRRTSPPPLPALDNPFAATAGDLGSEAAILAAEAAAVRALDSGPLTPLPDVVPVAPPPLPEGAFLPPTPPPEVMPVAPTPLPEAMSIAPMPLPEVVWVAPTPPPEMLFVAPTPPPEGAVADPVDDVASIPTPPPEPRKKVAIAEASASSMTPAPDIAGALPVRAMGSDGSAASADLPTVATAATPATPVPIGEPEDDLPGEVDEIEVVEARDGVDARDGMGDSAPRSEQQPETSRPNPASPSGVRPPPPPIPGSYLKTPGPELRAAPAAVFEEAHGPLLPALPILPEALSLRPRRPKRSKPWFEEVFDEDYLRTLPFMRADQTLREVEFISNALQTPPGAEILDVGCGYGRHAIELVQRGFSVTGLDLSLPLLIRAADEAQRRALSVNFVHADMREMSFERQFDGAYSMMTSFGYFDEETNLRVAERIGRALKPGRRFLLEVVNRDYVVSDLPVRVWWEGTGCVVLEEVDFNFHTSRINTHRSIVFEDGRQLEQELSVRAYSLHEIGRLLRQAGFRVIDVSGGLALRGQFFGGSSRSLLIVAEKREEDA